jgi:hypothetical protein
LLQERQMKLRRFELMPDGSVKKPVRFVVPKPKPRPMDGPATLIGVGPGTQVQIRQLEVDYNLKRIPNKGYSNTRMKRFTNFQVVMYLLCLMHFIVSLFWLG